MTAYLTASGGPHPEEGWEPPDCARRGARHRHRPPARPPPPCAGREPAPAAAGRHHEPPGAPRRRAAAPGRPGRPRRGARPGPGTLLAALRLLAARGEAGCTERAAEWAPGRPGWGCRALDAVGVGHCCSGGRACAFGLHDAATAMCGAARACPREGCLLGDVRRASQPLRPTGLRGIFIGRRPGPEQSHTTNSFQATMSGKRARAAAISDGGCLPAMQAPSKQISWRGFQSSAAKHATGEVIDIEHATGLERCGSCQH